MSMILSRRQIFNMAAKALVTSVAFIKSAVSKDNFSLPDHEWQFNTQEHPRLDPDLLPTLHCNGKDVPVVAMRAALQETKPNGRVRQFKPVGLMAFDLDGRIYWCDGDPETAPWVRV